MATSTIFASSAPEELAPRRDGLVIASIAFLIYGVCGREAWHGIDMLALLSQNHTGGMSHPYYWFFPSLLRAMQAVVEPFGGGIYHGGLLLTALGTAVGVACVHAAGREIGLQRSAAAFAALVMATMPGIVYFAVVVEVNGHLLAFCGLAWLLMARWAAAPRPRRAVAVGVALGLAWLAHPMAALVGAAMVPFASLATPGPAIRVRLLGFVLACGSLILWIAVVSMLSPASGPIGDDSSIGETLWRFVRTAQSAGTSFSASIAREWLLPFLPGSVAVVGLLWSRRARASALATLAATLPFVLISWLILWEDEHGAYVATASGLLALTLAAHLPLTWFRAAWLALAVGAAVWCSRDLQVTPTAAATTAAVHAAVGDRPMAWLVGDAAGPDGQVWLTRYPKCHVRVLATLLSADLLGAEETLTRIGAEVDGNARRGMPTIITSTTLDTLAMFAAGHAVARMIHDWLLLRRGEVLGQAGGITVFEVRGRRPTLATANPPKRRASACNPSRSALPSHAFRAGSRLFGMAAQAPTAAAPWTITASGLRCRTRGNPRRKNRHADRPPIRQHAVHGVAVPAVGTELVDHWPVVSARNRELRDLDGDPSADDQQLGAGRIPSDSRTHRERVRSSRHYDWLCLAQLLAIGPGPDRPARLPHDLGRQHQHPISDPVQRTGGERSSRRHLAAPHHGTSGRRRPPLLSQPIPLQRSRFAAGQSVGRPRGRRILGSPELSGLHTRATDRWPRMEHPVQHPGCRSASLFAPLEPDLMRILAEPDHRGVNHGGRRSVLP